MTKEYIEDFYRTYYENEKKIRTLDNQLFEAVDSADQWTSLLRNRSSVIRSIYQENMTYINSIFGTILDAPDILTADLADFIIHKIQEHNMYSAQDYMLNRPLLLCLLDFYRTNGSFEQTFQVYGLLGNCYIPPLIEEDYCSDFDFQKKAALDLSQYRSYQPAIRESVLRQNYNDFVLSCIYTAIPYEYILERGSDLIRFYNSSDVQNDLHLFQRITPEQLIYACKMNVVEAYYGKPIPSAATTRLIHTLAHQLLSEKQYATDPTLQAYCFYWDYLNGDITGDEYFNELYHLFTSTGDNCNYYETISSIKDASKMPYTFYIAADVVHAIRYTSYSPTQRTELYIKVTKKFMDDVNLAKRGLFDIILSNYIQRFIYALDDYCGPKEFLLNTIVNISIHQQIQTYLHSIMVKHISLMIFDELFDHAPELFLGFKGYHTLAELTAHQNEIREYVRCAALLHDIGKLRIAAIINLQCRKLTDHEFHKIQDHPRYGQKIIARFPCLTEYSDVILGHHRSYDGKKGYPADFDVSASPYKPAIDLITIADSVDAATDILGRNYTTGKTFNKVLVELLEGAGTRYSDELVHFIDSRPDLKRALTYLLTTDRIRIYREIYTNIISLPADTIENGCHIYH